MPALARSLPFVLAAMVVGLGITSACTSSSTDDAAPIPDAATSDDGSIEASKPLPPAPPQYVPCDAPTFAPASCQSCMALRCRDEIATKQNCCRCSQGCGGLSSGSGLSCMGTCLSCQAASQSHQRTVEECKAQECDVVRPADAGVDAEAGASADAGDDAAVDAGPPCGR